MALGKGESNDASHAVADDDRLLELKLAAEEGEIVGKELHGVGATRFVALTMSAEIDCDDPVALACEMLELGRKEGVVAAPAMHEEERPFLALHLLVEERNPIPLQLRHSVPFPVASKAAPRHVITSRGACAPSIARPWG
jgi:hypothetical protein